VSNNSKIIENTEDASLSIEVENGNHKPDVQLQETEVKQTSETAITIEMTKTIAV
jgi:hypothetical protein